MLTSTLSENVCCNRHLPILNCIEVVKTLDSTGGSHTVNDDLTVLEVSTRFMNVQATEFPPSQHFHMFSLKNCAIQREGKSNYTIFRGKSH